MNKSVLERLFAQQDSLRGDFCFHCGAAHVQKKIQHGNDVFYCQQCHTTSPRAYIFDNKAVMHIEQTRLIHETVGAIIRHQVTGGVLLFLRRKYPFQYTLPAGHLEQGQTPLEEIAREVTEETGFSDLSWETLTPDQGIELYDPCRRGADWHRWHVFKSQTTQQPQLSEEGRIIGWYTQQEITQLHQLNLLTPPTAYWLQKYVLSP